jgi:hypothetical protein
VILNVPQISAANFGDLWNNHLWENIDDMCCPMCASWGLKRILQYRFGASKYLILNFVRGITDNGMLLPQAIVNHPEDTLRLQG